MKSSVSHNIKNREKPNDVFYTPIPLVETCYKIGLENSITWLE